MKMKTVCKSTGLTDRTVRYYIQEGLIAPAYSENYLGRKTYDFTESNVKMLSDIAVLRKFGFSILEIKEMLLHPEAILPIVNDLCIRKKADINNDARLLQVLSQLDATHCYTVSELANQLSAPVANIPVPRKDVIKLRDAFQAGFIAIGIASALTIIAPIIILIMIILTGCIINIAGVLSIQYTETTNIADYGTYTGTYNDEYVQSYIDSFFPEEISTSFTNIKYSYKAKQSDTYAFEAYLEFTIEDETEFINYIQSIASEDVWNPFPYDESFMEYKIDNSFDIHITDPRRLEENPGHAIESAGIKKILYCAETQTIIYVAIGVYDGGSVDTDYLCVFFERFDIDPVKYEKSADL